MAQVLNPPEMEAIFRHIQNRVKVDSNQWTEKDRPAFSKHFLLPSCLPLILATC
jgi:hypothetical protein